VEIKKEGIKMRDAIGDFYIKNEEVISISNWQNQEGSNIIYEVIRVIEGKPLFYGAHYNRIINSCRLSDVEFKINKESLKTCIESLIKVNGIEEGNLKVTFKIKDEDLRLFFIRHSYPTEDMYASGVKTILYFGERTNPNAKILNNDFRQEVQKKIKEANVFEAILVNGENNITEGSKSNIFFIKNNILFTSKVELVLPGVTRTEIIKVAKENNIVVVEENINKDNLDGFDSAFISGTSPNILPIRQVEGIKFSTNNQLLRQLMTLFKERIKEKIKINR
jgi:branched-chain amino acid aminotransferase